MKMSIYAKAALEIMKAGGYMRSEKQPDGSTLVRLYNSDGHKLLGHYNAVQIVLDGQGLLNGAIVHEHNKHIMEWTYWSNEEPWDYDPRDAKPVSIYG
jgi:hypothetical protein